ncbi:class I SAM-dependent methyltransferase [Arthrobacter sp. H35-D1]|uniref:SAM-dependent methyltransferase n=1 Tax=Arthrobacter sp. H35-D1 TaxID=3046202 RepID=UPI0024B8ED64|nr:class I SAM-dependent methyltransferase [Arthrobacter sp. H35-D1]MDJ0313608.1 class I SAM-dependent methyltransferase [Arthrobacter sp. H35-D1]
MSLLERPAAPLRGSSRLHWFGQGAEEPYAAALRQGKGILTLEPHAPNERVTDEAVTHEAVTAVHLRVQQWCEPATPAEVSLLLATGGPVLDAGCGPGRMLVAAERIGLRALGIDVSREAVAQARSRGAKALHQSIFQALPHEGAWGTALLLDGNVGIGGNVPVLLRRMDQVLCPSGSILIEVDVQDGLDVSYSAVLRGEGTEASEPFAWARVGSEALERYAAGAGWDISKRITIPSTRRVPGSPASGPCQERVVCRLLRRE